MNFRKTSERGGSFPIQKISLRFFGNFEGENNEFLGNLGGSLQSEKFVAKKRNIVFRNEGGGVGVRGGLEVFRKYIQNGP